MAPIAQGKKSHGIVPHFPLYPSQVSPPAFPRNSPYFIFHFRLALPAKAREFFGSFGGLAVSFPPIQRTSHVHSQIHNHIHIIYSRCPGVAIQFGFVEVAVAIRR